METMNDPEDGTEMQLYLNLESRRISNQNQMPEKKMGSGVLFAD